MGRLVRADGCTERLLAFPADAEVSDRDQARRRRRGRDNEQCKGDDEPERDYGSE